MKGGSPPIFGAHIVHALHVVRARVDVVATKLGIIVLSFSSMHGLFSQKGFA